VPCALVIAASYLARLSLLRTRTFDPDEFEHLHAAWEFHRGLLPFRDFFEHHMPGMYYLLAAMLGGFDVTNRVSDALHFLFVARTAMWGITGGIVLLTVLLGARVGGRIVGWISGALLSLSIVFVARTLEIRPDVPGLAFWVASQVAFMYALAPTRLPGGRRLFFAVGGLCLGCALLFTQKILLAGPGFAMFALLYLASRVPASSLASRVVDIATLLAGCALPLALLVAHFWTNHAVADLVRGVLTNNLGWPQEVEAAATIRWMLLRDPLLCAAAVAGLLQTAFVVIRREHDWMAQAVVLLPTASVVAGLAIIPTPYPQYLMLTFPAAAAWGAAYVWKTAQSGAVSSRRSGGAERLMLLATCAVVAAVGLAVARPVFRHPLVYPLFGGAALGTAIACARARRPAWSTAVVVAALAAFSAQQLLWMQGLSNADALQQMRYIHASTRPTDLVMDGFTGFGWFRPQAAFHWFVPPGARAMMTADEKARMVTLLRDCEHGPTVVILDKYLRDLAPDVGPTVARYYKPTQYPLLWVSERTSAGCSGASVNPQAGNADSTSRLGPRLR